jgi:regulator of sigma E protease
VSVNGVAVTEYDYGKYVAELVKSTDKPLKIGIHRARKKGASQDASSAEIEAAKTQPLEFEIPPQPMRGFGLVLTMGPVTAVQKRSPAEEAGVMAGDRITAVDGKAMAESAENPEGWTPMTLPEYLRKAAMEDREVELTLRRGAGKNSEGEELKLRMKPIVPRSVPSAVPPGAPIGADAIGVAYAVENEVHSVTPSSPAALAGVAVGDRLASATIYVPGDKQTKRKAAQEEVMLGPEHLNWPAIMDAVQLAPAGTQVELSVFRGDQKEPIKLKRIAPQEVNGVYIAARGLEFEPIFRTRTASSFSEAVRYGYDETLEALTMVFRFLQKLGGQVPFKMLGGPGTIAVAAGDAASHGLSSLLIFLTMLSANLAVINFLPIPLLDGGHMMFLTYEGLRGRPANEKVVLGLHMAGFAFIISLMVYVIGLDIHRWILT